MVHRLDPTRRKAQNGKPTTEQEVHVRSRVRSVLLGTSRGEFRVNSGTAVLCSQVARREVALVRGRAPGILSRGKALRARC